MAKEGKPSVTSVMHDITALYEGLSRGYAVAPVNKIADIGKWDSHRYMSYSGKKDERISLGAGCGEKDRTNHFATGLTIGCKMVDNCR